MDPSEYKFQPIGTTFGFVMLMSFLTTIFVEKLHKVVHSGLVFGKINELPAKMATINYCLLCQSVPI